MWHNIFTNEIPYTEKIIRTVLVYALLVVIFRIVGKTAISSLNTMDFVVMLLVSNVVQNAIIGPDNSFSGAAVGTVTLIVVNEAVDRLAYWYPGFRRLVEGHQTQVIVDGKIRQRALDRLAIRPAELQHAARVQNGNSLSEVKSGVLESNGQLVLTLKEDDRAASVKDVAELKAALVRIEALLAAGAKAP